jgi:hypothetical protein
MIAIDPSLQRRRVYTYPVASTDTSCTTVIVVETSTAEFLEMDPADLVPQEEQPPVPFSPPPVTWPPPRSQQQPARLPRLWLLPPRRARAPPPANTNAPQSTLNCGAFLVSDQCSTLLSSAAALLFCQQLREAVLHKIPAEVSHRDSEPGGFKLHGFVLLEIERDAHVTLTLDGGAISHGGSNRGKRLTLG